MALYGAKLELDHEALDLLWSVVSKLDRVDREWTLEQMKRDGEGGMGPPRDA